MGYPATTEPPQHYSRRRVYSLAVLPAAFTPATPSVLHPKHCTIHRPGGVLRGPSPGLVRAFFYPPVFEF